MPSNHMCDLYSFLCQLARVPVTYTLHSGIRADDIFAIYSIAIF